MREWADENISMESRNTTQHCAECKRRQDQIDWLIKQIADIYEGEMNAVHAEVTSRYERLVTERFPAK